MTAARPLRIVHAADLHLDSPFQSLTREQAALRRAEQRTLLSRIAALAAEQQADMLLLAGDLFDSEAAFSDTARLVAQVLSALPIPVFIAPGNHDPWHEHSAWAGLSLGPNVHLFTREEPTYVLLPELRARVWGAAFTGPSKAAQLVGFAPEKLPGVTDLLVLHGEVGRPGSVYGPISLAALAASGMDYCALGHIHRYEGPAYAGSVCYAWPGCPEGRGFDEAGEKGVLVTEVLPGRCRVRFLPLDGRRYETIDVPLSDETDPFDAVAAALPSDAQKHVLRLRLTGEITVPPDLPALRRALEGRCFALELRDETRPPQALWDHSGTDTLRGLFLTTLRRRYDAATQASERERIVQADRWGLRAMENGEELPL